MPGQKRDEKLHDQHPHRVERGNHRSLAQAHQAKKRAGGDIGPPGAEELGVGAKDALFHAVAHDVRPDEDIEGGFGRYTVDLAFDVPAVAPLAVLVGFLGAQRDVVARYPRLFRALLAVEFAVAAGVDRIVPRDIENAPFAHRAWAAHDLGPLYRASLAQVLGESKTYPRAASDGKVSRSQKEKSEKPPVSIRRPIVQSSRPMTRSICSMWRFIQPMRPVRRGRKAATSRNGTPSPAA